MKSYIFGARSKVHIINLRKPYRCLTMPMNFISSSLQRQGTFRRY
ncbi:30S ribosomal protein S2 [Shigella flexneri]